MIPAPLYEPTAQTPDTPGPDFMETDAGQESFTVNASGTAEASLFDHSSLPPVMDPPPVEPPAEFTITQYKTVFAKRGDMVSTFVLKEYGTINQTIFDIVKRSNPDIEDLDNIDIGTKIMLPVIDFDCFILELEKNMYSVHLASFTSYENAKEYLITLNRFEYPLFLTPVKIAGNDPWYRITAGSFTSREMALEAAKKLKLDLILNFT